MQGREADAFQTPNGQRPGQSHLRQPGRRLQVGGFLDESGNNVDFDIDLCRALAAAVLGNPHAIEVPRVSAAERGPTIRSGDVDILGML